MKQTLLLAAVCSSLFAQPLAFEAASVKAHPKDALIVMIGGSPSGSRLSLEAMSLSDLISWSYEVRPWQVTGGPAWAGMPRDRTNLDGNSRRFDIVAKAPGDAVRSLEDFRQMMQTLLAERFSLSVHRETREIPAYLLTLDRGGSRLKESRPEAPGILRMNGGGKITASGGTVTQLANFFSNANGVDRPVLDRTGLTGRYDFTLEWSIPRADNQDSSAPSIFTAMPEQLGLRLIPQKAPIEFLVIDRAEMPGDN